MYGSFLRLTFNLLGEGLQQLQPHLQQKHTFLRPPDGIQTHVHARAVSLRSCRCGVWTPGQSTPSPAASGDHRLCWRSLHLKPFAGEELESGVRGIIGSADRRPSGDPGLDVRLNFSFTQVLCIMRIYVITVIGSEGTRGLVFNVSCRGSHNWSLNKKQTGKENGLLLKSPASWELKAASRGVHSDKITSSPPGYLSNWAQATAIKSLIPFLKQTLFFSSFSCI